MATLFFIDIKKLIPINTVVIHNLVVYKKDFVPLHKTVLLIGWLDGVQQFENAKMSYFLYHEHL